MNSGRRKFSMANQGNKFEVHFDTDEVELLCNSYNCMPKDRSPSEYLISSNDEF